MNNKQTPAKKPSPRPLIQEEANHPIRSSMLSQFAEQLDGQLNRMYNSLNTLAVTSDRLLSTKDNGVSEQAPEPHDFSGRFSNLITYFSCQNERLEALNNKLSDLI